MADTSGSRFRFLVHAVLGCLALAGQCPAQMAPAAGQNLRQDILAVPQGQFVNRVFKDAQGGHKYVVFVPANYSPDKKWPVILFLHGASNRGTDGRSQLVSGIASAIRLRMSDYPFVVVFPQCENVNSRMLGGWTDQPEDSTRALQILDAVEKDYNVDTKRECLVGISMGGTGAWNIAAKTPQRWAALVPVSAMADTADAPKVAGIPTWVFHAAYDPLVASGVARNMVGAVQTASGRAYYSEVPKKAHDLSNVVFTQQALTNWLLDPRREPDQNLEWTEPKGYGSGLDLEVPFVPGAEIASALRIRVCRDVLDALGYAAPDKLAAKPLSGSVAPVHQSKLVGGFLPVDVALTGLYYQGHIERIRIIPKAPNRLILQAGLRNLTMTVSNSQLSSKVLLSASAGPMNVVIGHRAPVWLTMELQPQVLDRRVHLNLTGMNFQIPADNWYVTQPSGVHVRGLPFLNGRVSDGLVDGFHARKGEIERQVLNGLPAMVQNIENRINEAIQARTISVGRIPMPLWQPRLKMFPEEILIDDDGITVVSGMTLCALGPASKDIPMLRYPAPKEFPAPVRKGVEINVAESVVAAWSQLVINSRVNSLNIKDFTAVEYHTLADREFLQEVIPDLKKFGDGMQTNVDFRLQEPIRLLTPAPSNAPKLLEHATGSSMMLSVASVPLRVAVRNKDGSQWTQVGELNMSIERDYAPSVKKAGFVRRELIFAELGRTRIVPRWTFAPGYNPENPHVDADRLVAAILKARDAAQSTEGVKPESVPDVVLLGVPLRLDRLDWKQDHIVSQFELPGVLVANDCNLPLTYEVRGPFTDWGRSRTLAPGEFDEYHVGYPLTWRRRSESETQYYTLPLGKEVSFQTTPKPGMVLVNHTEDLGDQHRAP